MTLSRIGRISTWGLRLCVTFTLFGGASACGDDDGSLGDGGAGASSAGTGTGGASAGRAGESAAGHPSPGPGGTAGGAGDLGGAGDTGTAGNSSILGGRGGASADSGSSGGGMGGNAGSSGGDFSGGAAGTAGSGGSAGAAGSGGEATDSVEYRSCEVGAAITRVDLYRIDRARGTCTAVRLQQGQVNCLYDLKSGGWCVIRAGVSDDVESCEALEPPENAVEASAGNGTFSITFQPLAVDIDLELEFPASGSLPQTVSFEAVDCIADCMKNDCRP